MCLPRPSNVYGPISSANGPAPSSAPPVTGHQQPAKQHQLVMYLPPMDIHQMPIVQPLQPINQLTAVNPPPMGIPMNQHHTTRAPVGMPPEMQLSPFQAVATPTTPRPNTRNHQDIKIQQLKQQNEQLQEKLKLIESSMVQFSKLRTNVESLICLIGTQQNTKPPQTTNTGRLNPTPSHDDAAFVVPPISKPVSGYATASCANIYSSPSTDGNKSYGTEDPSLPRKPPSKHTPATSPDSTDTEQDPILPPEMEVLADLISPNGLKFLTMTHTKASSQTSVRTWATAVCSAIHQDNSLGGALLPRKEITEDSFLNPNMTTKQRHKIFNTLYKSFDTDVLNYLNLQFNESVEMDALLLWNKFQEA